MNEVWKKCPRGDAAGRWARPYVTMNKRGFIVMSRKTYENIKEPAAVCLYFDPVNRRIGIEPARPGAEDAYPVAKQGRHGGRLIRAHRLMVEFGIDIPGTIKFVDITQNREGMLVLDLRTAQARQKASR
jgi:hypothetical protein